MSRLRVIYVAGVGDAFHTFREWRDGRPDRKNSHVTYSSQFYDVCRELDAEALVLCNDPNGPDAPLTNGSITIERRPNWLEGTTRWSYQARGWDFARSVSHDVERFRANILVTPDQPHLFLLANLRLRGVSIFHALHCKLWGPHVRRSPTNRATMALLGLLYPNLCDGVLSVSEDIDAQVRAIARQAGRRPPPIASFVPHYTAEMYGGLARPVRGAVARFAFAGRVEADKGVFTLLDIAARLRARGRTDIAFDVCGTGSALEELRARVAAQKLESTFVIHGWCDHERLREIYGRSYAVVVPTTAHFVEGFNKVVVEGLLSGRPVITSSVCPVVKYVEPAVLQVPPDDASAYERAILQLADDPITYERLRRACEPYGRRFLDESTSYRAALRHAFAAVVDGRRMTPRPLGAAPPGERAPRVSAV